MILSLEVLTLIPNQSVFSYGIAAISPFSHRLAFDNMPIEIQRLRCKVNFQALTFVPHIKALGDALVHRLQYPSSRSTTNEPGLLQQVTDRKSLEKPKKFVVVHLRFDKVQ
uniref:O-fucosyltransferase family protein n=1 Tax=Opuntia streptacantha TaxID=393608 RepID=A0A7C9E2W0_OPUST